MILFPARATHPDGTVTEPVKVFERGQRVDVVALDDQRRPVVLVSFDRALTRRRVDAKAVLVAETDEGEWTFVRGTGCGCSHPLKRVSGQQVDQELAAPATQALTA